MNNELLVENLKTSGRVSCEQVSRWTDAAGLMAALDAIGRDGVNVVVKIDGARPDGAVYTVVISGAKLGESFFRKDGDNIHILLQDAIEFYKGIYWLEKSKY